MRTIAGEKEEISRSDDCRVSSGMVAQKKKKKIGNFVFKIGKSIVLRHRLS